MFRKITALFLCLIFISLLAVPVFSSTENDTNVLSAANINAPETNCISAVLMEATTGTVLYEKEADKALPPASVTKIMTLLIVMEAIQEGSLKWTDTVTAGAHATSMGGSQIYLKEGEQMSVEDLVKSVVIASANDAALALAEHICGSEEVFVAKMNLRAAELGMRNTNFENTNGLDDTTVNHVTSARDIAIMSRELIKHKEILKYSSTWMDSVRNGTFGLTNTNRLVRFYNGCTGLKTGSTSKAKFCISATAERDGMPLIAVIMASPSRDERNESAKALLDWGYANFALYKSDVKLPERVTVLGGKSNSCRITAGDCSVIVKKGSVSKINSRIDLPERINAPLKKGDVIGNVVYTLDGKEISKINIVCDENTEKINYFGVLQHILSYFLLKSRNNY